jgi:hypothetical protein
MRRNIPIITCRLWLCLRTAYPNPVVAALWKSSRKKQTRNRPRTSELALNFIEIRKYKKAALFVDVHLATEDGTTL